MTNGGVGSHSGWKLEKEKEGKYEGRERERMKILRTTSIIYPKICVYILEIHLKEAIKE